MVACMSTSVGDTSGRGPTGGSRTSSVAGKRAMQPRRVGKQARRWERGGGCCGGGAEGARGGRTGGLLATLKWRWRSRSGILFRSGPLQSAPEPAMPAPVSMQRKVGRYKSLLLTSGSGWQPGYRCTAEIVIHLTLSKRLVTIDILQ